MTTETDLLPLPEGYAAWYYIGSTHVYSAGEMESYARANVARAVEPLQAEIEALREEMEEWKAVAKCASEQQDSLFMEARALNELADNLRAEVYFRDSVIATHAADTREYQKRISQAEARAEQLAEAISAYKSECDNPAKDYVLRAKRRDEMFALLRDQEEGNGQ